MTGFSPMKSDLVVVAAAVILAGCAQPGAGAPPANTVVVSAASSLTDAFGEIAAAFESEHPGTSVVLNIGASSSLRRQISEGAPVDVFASADTVTMNALEASGDIDGSPQIFATNTLAIAVPVGNPSGVTGLIDLANDALFVGLCAPEVPCGELARTVLSAAGVAPSVDTYEPDVRSLLTRIALGELDVGIVYVTDVAASDEVDGIAIGRDVNITTSYPIAIVGGAPNPDDAEAFAGFVMSDVAHTILDAHGFGAP